MNKPLFKAGLLLLAALALPTTAQANAPEITPSLKKMLGSLPIAEVKNQVQGMIGALQKTNCGGKLTGCYMTQSGPLQLYFFTSGQSQQTFLLVVDKTMPMPQLLGDKVQAAMGNTTLSSPIISISTTDYALDIIKMPPSLQKVIRESYFNVNSLSFSSGVQLTARANLAGAMKSAMESFGAKSDQLTIRAAVVLPIPADLAGGAGAGAGMADAVRHGDTMKKAGADAAMPEAFLEFQFAPNTRLAMISPPMELTDATFFINNALTFGYKGNAVFKGAENRKIIIQFQTPWNPAGALDLLDFQFRMATPAVFTLEDAARVMFAMATPDPRLAKYGGGFIRNIDSYKNALLSVTTPLSVFQLKNPNPAEYRFGDSTKPFPNDAKHFNYAILGPLAEGGPYMRQAGDIKILGQKMGWLDASAGGNGLAGDVGAGVTLKLGPLGKVDFKMDAAIKVNGKQQDIGLTGNFAGQKISVILSGSTMTIAMNASCVNPFEIKTKVAIQADSDIAKIFEGQGGVNVDPSKISGCIGKELEAAYKKIAGEYKNLSGYTASAASAELNKIANAAEAEAQKVAKAAEQEAQKAAEASRKEYEKTKNAARDKMSQTSNDAMRAFNDAGNALKGIGKKKKHKSKPDARLDRSVFNWDYYYDKYPDVVRSGMDLVTHWTTYGFKEGRQGSIEFSAKDYLARYPDLQRNLGDFDGVLWHWVNYGPAGGRQGSPDFSVRAYLTRYPDLQRAFGSNNYDAAFDHWMDHGKHEGRNSRP
ncbi:MAG: lectin [Burkholderiales bacterium RIFCSPLOWO2_02_FULL_57_36]|nr:MAG: lectin [Burkholderiales bacterium RIFCSPLOWO2_02_FULL_57_36]